jgi:hypothetical protein
MRNKQIGFDKRTDPPVITWKGTCLCDVIVIICELLRYSYLHRQVVKDKLSGVFTFYFSDKKREFCYQV